MLRKLLFKSLLLALLAALVLAFYHSLPDVGRLRRQNPRMTALMELRERESRRVPRQQIWVRYEAISDHLKKAVVLGEDAAFFTHPGVDFNELKAALKADWESLSFKRGGSTITMQLARNLYLTPSKNPLRKLREIVIAWQLERKLSKRRIFEIYLNVVEWGRHIYGAEAAARHYFAKPVSAVDPVEAATLAALLPSPRQWSEKAVIYRRNVILERMTRVGYLDASVAMRAKQTALFEKSREFTGASLRRLPSLADPLDSSP